MISFSLIANSLINDNMVSLWIMKLKKIIEGFIKIPIKII